MDGLDGRQRDQRLGNGRRRGDILRGVEGHGIIEFIGTFTSISWTIPFGEFWHGFQIGIPSIARVPEPGTLALLALGLVSLALPRRRRRD